MSPWLIATLGFAFGAAITALFCQSRSRRLFDQEHTARTVAETRLQESLRNLNEQRALLGEAETRWKDAFENLSSKALGSLQEGARQDLGERQKALESVLKPLQETLHVYQQQLQKQESTQSNVFGQVRAQIEALMQQNQLITSETSLLRRVLSSNQARGKWGEETLRRVVEASGMSSHCDFVEQTMQGDAKPDLIVKLPGDRLIIVDAKVPDLEFLTGLDSGDETARKSALEQHAAKLKLTVRALAERNYPAQFPTALDHVILFLPAESLFSAALEGDHELILWAANRQITLATPASLIAILRAVAFSWQQQQATENAQRMIDAGSDLYERVCKFVEHLVRMREALERATGAFNDAVGSWERRIVPSGERLKKLGASRKESDSLEIESIESLPRTIPTPALQLDPLRKN